MSLFQGSGAVVEVEVAVLGSPSLIIIMVSVDVKQHWWRNHSLGSDLERCEQGGAAGFSYQDGLFCCCVCSSTVTFQTLSLEGGGAGLS